MPTVLCLGISVLDYVFAVAAMPVRAEKHRSERLEVIGGGLAANAAVAVARLGGSARLVTRLGDDAVASEIVARLEAEGVDCRLARRFAGRRSPVSSVFVDPQGERMVMSFADPQVPREAAWLGNDVLAGVDAVHGDNRWEEGAAHVFRLASKRGIPSLLDCDRAPRDEALLALPSHVAFSAQGLAEVSGTTDPQEGLRRLSGRGLANRLMVTLGAAGVMVWDGARGVHHRGFDVAVVDTLAAGDVWHGAFALALAERRAEPDAIRFAHAAAALKCTRFGGRAGTPHRAEVDRFLREKRQ